MINILSLFQRHVGERNGRQVEHDRGHDGVDAGRFGRASRSHRSTNSATSKSI